VTARGILRVAVNAPLPRLFDYLPPRDAQALPAVGSRVRIPFGQRRETGLVMAQSEASEVPPGKLRRALGVCDETPLLDEDDLWLIRFTSDYYHHPIGEVVAAALPALLRQGRPLVNETEFVEVTALGAGASGEHLARRAPRQAEVLAWLEAQGGSLRRDLDEALPAWTRVRKTLVDKGWIRISRRALTPDAKASGAEPVEGPALNAEQRRAVASLRAARGFAVTLLDGVTGSGKTEVYLQVMLDVLAAGRQVLVLVPEIGLTPQFVERLTRRLGTSPALLHSGLTDVERLDAWRLARSGAAGIVLGTRSAVFSPLAKPGLIVVDEEHDTSFKQQEGLRYSARDIAIARAKRLDIPVILGSATPSLDTLRRAEEGAYAHLTLTARAGGAMPPHLRLVDLNRYRSDDGLSPPLIAAIERHLERKGQALIFLNRRGFAPTLICSACGQVAECNRCDSRMTVHRREQTLVCHHCGAARALDASCAACGGRTVPLGEGTERIEDALLRRFPGRSVTRIDSDSTRLKGAMDKALARAVSGEAEILVGTQMLSKGHHFPRLTLVGVVNADQGLFSTDFRGGERLAQSLVQVAGRAGRERVQGEVFIQTAFPDHPFWRELLSGGYHRVARFALAEREAAGWPPYSRLALIRASAHRREQNQAFLERAASIARSLDDGSVRVLGPVTAPMERRAGRYRGQLLLQTTMRRALHDLLADLRGRLTDDPAARRVRWSIDVDPIELF
jgi:primosomal protein N' (replication factor Y)